MKPPTHPLLLILSTLATIPPTSQTVIDKPPNLAPQEACTLRTWSGTQCDGTNHAEYWYVADEGCRSCRNNHGESHSFSLSGHCLTGTVLLWRTDECDADDDHDDENGIEFYDLGCFTVDPNTPWNSSQPCFK